MFAEISVTVDKKLDWHFKITVLVNKNRNCDLEILVPVDKKLELHFKIPVPVNKKWIGDLEIPVPVEKNRNQAMNIRLRFRFLKLQSGRSL